jgi:Uma2 family endonuclease
VEVVTMALPQVLEEQRQTQRLRWEDYAQMPPTGEHAEVEDGEVIHLAGASWRHQSVLGALYRLLASNPQVQQLGKVMLAPFDVVVSREPLRVRQPDLFFVRSEKIGEVTETDLLTRLEFPPDLVIEVISPNDTVEHVNAKLADYHALGVPEVWLVDLTPNHVFVLTREEDDWRWHQPVSGEERIPSQQLPQLQVSAKAVFEG